MNTCIFSIIMVVGSLSLLDIIIYQNNFSLILPLLPFIFMLFIISLAEINRAPFDLPEAEAELVSGYNVEYSAMTFALFFLGEYANMLLMSTFSSILFLGGWLPLFNIFPLNWLPGSFWLSLKILLGVVFFILTFFFTLTF